jgi:predicted phage terminase large subunit-like protein
MVLLSSPTPNELEELLPYLTQDELDELDNLIATAPDILPYVEWLGEVSPRQYRWDYAYLLYVIDTLVQFFNGEIKRLMIFMPPRHMKSSTVTERAPAYLLERDPTLRIFIGAATQRLAERFSRKNRAISWARRVEMNPEKQSAAEWETAEGGGLQARGVGGTFVGLGSDFTFLDDVIPSREKADSEAYRQMVYGWYTDDVDTRLEPDGSICIINTRWHEADLSGQILSSEEADQWTVISLPAIAEENDPLGRKEGEALCPERYPIDVLREKRKRSPSTFAALYQQRPQDREGGMFKREWWVRVKIIPPLPRVEIFIDTAVKEGVENDRTAIGVYGTDNLGRYYMIYVWTGRVAMPGLLNQIMDVWATYRHLAPIVPIHIEDKGSGSSAIQTLRQPRQTETGQWLPALPVVPYKLPPGQSKQTRADGVTWLVSGHFVHIPEGAPWAHDFIEETAAFPTGKHDDQVDMTSMALTTLSQPISDDNSEAYDENPLYASANTYLRY